MDLLDNPFHLLGASLSDNSIKITDLADERSLMFNSEECLQARSDLTHPRRRLSSEIAWLPGFNLENIADIISDVESNPTSLISKKGSPSIARANILAAGLARIEANKVDNVVNWILEISMAFEGVKPDELREIINEGRNGSGFAEVSALSDIVAELKDRRMHYRKIIKSVLDNFSFEKRIAIVTAVVESATKSGEVNGPILVSDLVNAYEVDVQEFLGKEKEKISSLIDKLRESLDAKQPDNVSDQLVSELIELVENWDVVAQPLQIITKSQGLDHEESNQVAHLVRDTALYVFNEHDKLEFSQRLTNMLQKVFAEVEVVAERTASDAVALQEIAEERSQGESLFSIFEMCKSASKNIEKSSSSAEIEAKRIVSGGPQLVKDLLAKNPSLEVVTRAKDEIAFTLMNCAVVYGNNTKKWGMCIAYLEKALEYSVSPETKLLIQKNLNVVKENNRLDTNVVSQESKGSGFAWFWIIGFIVFVIWISNNKQGSSTNTGSAVPTKNKSVTSNQKISLRYTKPSIGENNVLDLSEIRWCIRESIRIEAMRGLFDNNDAIGRFNQIVSDSNSRCGSYRYRQGAQAQAEREVQASRKMIIFEAIQTAHKLNGSKPLSSIAPNQSICSQTEKPSAQQTRKVQTMLKRLGYDPGVIDGQYGGKTSTAVKSFQYDTRVSVDGCVDQELLNLLRKSLDGKISSVQEEVAPKVEVAEAPPKLIEGTVDRSQAAKGYFTRGSDKSEVMAIQGTPTAINRYSDHEDLSYAFSTVRISKSGKVSAWSNASKNLKVKMESGRNVTTKWYFTRGAHQDDVLRVQGTPTAINLYSEHEDWSYGYSTVRISKGRKVESWNNTSKNLKVKMEPGRNITSKWFFSRGAHQDDVLRVQGTPTVINLYSDHEDWSYGYSSVRISKKRKVESWNNIGKTLKVKMLPGRNVTDKWYFIQGAHQDDVLRIQGTPTSINRYSDHEDWSYGYSTVRISRNRRVESWTNTAGNLKVK